MARNKKKLPHNDNDNASKSNNAGQRANNDRDHRTLVQRHQLFLGQTWLLYRNWRLYGCGAFHIGDNVPVKHSPQTCNAPSSMRRL